MLKHPVLLLAALVLVGFLCQWVAWRMRLPAILLLLLVGILAGPVLGVLDPDALFGDLLFPFVSLSVAVILFEGSLTLKWKRLRGLGGVVRRMVGIGLLITWAIAAWAAHRFTGLDWELAILFGSLVVVTGPTVIAPMLRTVRPTRAVSEVLRWEGIVIDPIGALLAVLTFEFLLARGQGDALGHTLQIFGLVLAIGVLAGLAGGGMLALALRRRWLPDYLLEIGVLGMVLATFAVSDALEPESGLIAVTVMGILLANLRRIPVEEILDFKESLSILLISGLFLILAARIDSADVELLGVGAVLVVLCLQFIARPLKVLFSTAGSTITWRERALLAGLAPRGIVAAAISAVFAERMIAEGHEQARLIVPLVFAVIVGTVLLQSLTARPLALLLKVAAPEARGFLCVGANPVARALGDALRRAEVPVLLAATNRDQIKAARLAGLPAWQGTTMHEREEIDLEFAGLGGLLAVTPNRALNQLAARHFRPDFGAMRVFWLRRRAEGEDGSDEDEAQERQGRALFGGEIAYDDLLGRLLRGGSVRATRLSEEFGAEEWRAQHPDSWPLFAVDPDGEAWPYVEGDEDALELWWDRLTADWRILSLAEADAPKTA